MAADAVAVVVAAVAAAAAAAERVDAVALLERRRTLLALRSFVLGRPLPRSPGVNDVVRLYLRRATIS